MSDWETEESAWESDDENLQMSLVKYQKVPIWESKDSPQTNNVSLVSITHKVNTCQSETKTNSKLSGKMEQLRLKFAEIDELEADLIILADQNMNAKEELKELLINELEITRSNIISVKERMASSHHSESTPQPHERVDPVETNEITDGILLLEDQVNLNDFNNVITDIVYDDTHLLQNAANNVISTKCDLRIMLNASNKQIQNESTELQKKKSKKSKKSKENNNNHKNKREENEKIKTNLDFTYEN